MPPPSFVVVVLYKDDNELGENECFVCWKGGGVMVGVPSIGVVRVKAD